MSAHAPGPIRVTGVLGRHAEARHGSGDTWWVFVEIHQGNHSLAVAAAQRIGSDVAADLASKSLARRLRQGDLVTVRAQGYDIVLQPSPHLVLREVEHIDAAAPTLSRCEPRDAIEVSHS